MAWLIDRDRFNRPTGIFNVPRPTVTLDIARRVEAQPSDGGAREALIAERRRALVRLGEQQELGAGMSSLQATMQQRLLELQDVQAGLEEAGAFRTEAIRGVEQGQAVQLFGNRLGEARASQTAQFQLADLVDQFKPEEPGPGWQQRAIGSQNTTDDNWFEYARELEGTHRLRQFQRESKLVGENGEARLLPFVAGLAREGISGNQFQRDLNVLKQGNAEAIGKIPVPTQEAYNRLITILEQIQDPIGFAKLQDPNRVEDDGTPVQSGPDPTRFPEQEFIKEDITTIGESLIPRDTGFDILDEAVGDRELTGKFPTGEQRQVSTAVTTALRREADKFLQRAGDAAAQEAILQGGDPQGLKFAVDVANFHDMNAEQFFNLSPSLQSAGVEQYIESVTPKGILGTGIGPDVSAKDVFGETVGGAVSDIAEGTVQTWQEQLGVLQKFIFEPEQKFFAGSGSGIPIGGIKRSLISAILQRQGRLPEGWADTAAKYINEFAVPTTFAGAGSKAPKGVSFGRRVLHITQNGLREMFVNTNQDIAGRKDRGEDPPTPEEIAFIALASGVAGGAAPELLGRLGGPFEFAKDALGRAYNTLNKRSGGVLADNLPSVLQVLDDEAAELVQSALRLRADVPTAVTREVPASAVQVAQDAPVALVGEGESVAVQVVTNAAGDPASAASADVGTLVARKNNLEEVFGEIVAKTNRGAVVLDRAGTRHTVPYRQLQPVTEKVLGADPTIQSVSQVAGAEGGGRVAGFDLTQAGGVAPNRLPAVQGDIRPVVQGGQPPPPAPETPLDFRGPGLVRDARLTGAGAAPDDAQKLLGPGAARRTLEGPGIGVPDNTQAPLTRGAAEGVQEAKETVAKEIVEQVQPRLTSTGERIASDTASSKFGGKFEGLGAKIVDRPFELPNGDSLPAGFAKLSPVRGTVGETRVLSGYTDPQGRFNAKSVKVGKGSRWQLRDLSIKERNNVVATFPTLKKTQARVDDIIQKEMNARTFVEAAPSDAGPAGQPVVKATTAKAALEDVSDMLRADLPASAKITLDVGETQGEFTLAGAVDVLVEQMERELPDIAGGSGRVAQEVVDSSATGRPSKIPVVGTPVNIVVQDTIPDNIAFYSGFMAADNKLISSQFSREGTDFLLKEGQLGTVMHDELLQLLGYNQATMSGRSQAAFDDGLIRIARPGNKLWAVDGGQNFRDVQRVANMLLDSGVSGDTRLAYDIASVEKGLPGQGSLPQSRLLPDANIGETSIQEIAAYRNVDSLTTPVRGADIPEIADVLDVPNSPGHGPAVRDSEGTLLTSRQVNVDPADSCK